MYQHAKCYLKKELKTAEHVTESNSPQCEWTTRRVEKMASVTGVVQMKGTMKAGICAADTNFGKD